MNKPRQDGWTEEHDAVLAETVLKHIREGSTQLAAFDEAAEALQRTSAACGFRWNSEVRKCYEGEIKQAKLSRQSKRASEGKKGSSAAVNSPQTEIFVTVSQLHDQNGYATDYVDQIINLAQNQKIQLTNMAKQIKSLNDQLSQKDREIQSLKRELEEANNTPNQLTVNEDYRTLLEILQRARQIGAIEESDADKPAFRMDANGNIEMIG